MTTLKDQNESSNSLQSVSNRGVATAKMALTRMEWSTEAVLLLQYIYNSQSTPINLQQSIYASLSEAIYLQQSIDSRLSTTAVFPKLTEAVYLKFTYSSISTANRSAEGSLQAAVDSIVYNTPWQRAVSCVLSCLQTYAVSHRLQRHRLTALIRRL